MTLRSVRMDSTLFRRLTIAGIAALAAIVVTGGAVRLTGSGLGCSTWPQCEPGHYVSAVAFHPLIEFGNRLVTVAVGVLVAALAVGSLLLRPRRRDVIALSWGLVVGYVAQAVLGGLSVLFKLAPPFVMAHFLVSMLLLADVVVLNQRLSAGGRPQARPELRWLSRAVVGVGALVLVVGTFVSGTGPHSGDSRESHRLHLLALTSITQLHSDIVLFLVGLVVALVVTLRLVDASRPDRRRAATLLAVMVAQAVVGFVQYYRHLPSGLVGVHILGATLFWVFALRFWLCLGEPTADERQAPATAGEPQSSWHAAAPARHKGQQVDVLRL